MLLQILTAGALVVGRDTLRFDRPATDLRTFYLYGTSVPTYFVTVDYTADFGTYSGPATFAIEVHGDRLGRMFVLASTGKQDWRVIDQPGTGRKEFHVVSCHSDFRQHPGDSVVFVIDYSTMRYDGHRWRTRTRTEPGFWERDDNAWPPPEKFP